MSTIPIPIMSSELQTAAVKGMAWTGLERLVSHGLRFGVAIVMARLLAPSDYGVIGMLGIFIAVAATFQDCGFTAALIQRKHCTQADYSTAYYFNLGIALILYAVLFFAAPVIAAFYNEPTLTSITRVVALGMVVQGLCSVHQTKLTIDLRFGVQSVIAITSLGVASVFGIVLAWRGYGAWALVWQSLAAAVFNLFAFWGVAHWHPSLVFSKASFRGLFGFGSKLLCSSLINTIHANLYTLVIGKRFSASETGFYNRAAGFAELPSGTLTGVILKVNYPVLAKLQDDNGQLLTAYRRLVRLAMFILMPMLFGMAVVAEPMVKVLIGERWLPCVPYLQVLCLGVLWNPLTHLNLNLLYVKNRTDLVLKLELIKKSIALIILFAMIPFGVWWMCVGKAVYDFIAFAINCHYTRKLLDYGMLRQLRELLPIFANSLVMSCVAYGTMQLVEGAAPELVLGVLSGAVAYALGAYLVPAANSS